MTRLISFITIVLLAIVTAGSAGDIQKEMPSLGRVGDVLRDGPVATGGNGGVEPPCLPTGLVAVSDWKIAGTQSQTIFDSVSRIFYGLRVFARAGTVNIDSMWIDGYPFLIDANPSDATVPLWVDAAVFDPAESARRDQVVIRATMLGARCQWSRYTFPTTRTKGVESTPVEPRRKTVPEAGGRQELRLLPGGVDTLHNRA